MLQQKGMGNSLHKGELKETGDKRETEEKKTKKRKNEKQNIKSG